MRKFEKKTENFPQPSQNEKTGQNCLSFSLNFPMIFVSVVDPEFNKSQHLMQILTNEKAV